MNVSNCCKAPMKTTVDIGGIYTNCSKCGKLCSVSLTEEQLKNYETKMEKPNRIKIANEVDRNNVLLALAYNGYKVRVITETSGPEDSPQTIFLLEFEEAE